MHRRQFGLSIGAAILLAQQLRDAFAQSATSTMDTDSARRMREAAAALLASLDEATRKVASFPLEWSAQIGSFEQILDRSNAPSTNLRKSGRGSHQTAIHGPAIQDRDHG